MPITQLQERAGTDSGIFGLKTQRHPDQSKFDLSRKLLTTIDIGGIYPIDVIPTIPNDKFKLSCRYQIDSFPLVVPPMTNYKVVTHWYYCRYQDLWKGAETYITKGRSGNIELKKPSFMPDRWYNTGHADDVLIANKPSPCFLDTPMSLTSFISGNIGRYSSGVGDGSIGSYEPYGGLTSSASQTFSVRAIHRVCALPYLMYQKIYRDNYAPINLLQDNKVWYPDDISGDDWRIDYDCSNLAGDLFVPSGHTINTDAHHCNFVPHASGETKDDVVSLTMLRYDTFDIDEFTSAKPFITRGSIPDMNVDISGVTSSLDFSDTFDAYTGNEGSFFYGLSVTSDGKLSGPSGSPENMEPALDAKRFGVQALNRGVVNTSGSAHASLTANNLRNMLAFSVFKEINAMTNGNYNSTIGAHYGIPTKHEDFEPRYIGGTVDYIQFAQILQTSASTADSKQGNQAGIGSVTSGGYIGDFTADDYGYIMGVMIIRPEVSYNQGVEKFDSALDADAEYWPEFASLGYQPILNKEVYFSDNSSVDDDLFGWQTRAYELKTRRNINRGLMALPSSSDSIASAYSQSREFSSLPKLSAQFVSMSPENVRRDFLAYPKQPAFKLQFASDVTAIRTVPYNTQPNTFGF